MAWPRVRQVDRLIGASVLGAVVMAWLVLVGFDTFTQFARQLGKVGEHGYTVAQAALYIAFTVPRRLCEMFGFAALIGSLMGLGALASSSELTALRAAGMSRWRIVASVLGWIAALTLVMVAIGETAAPAGEQRAQALLLSQRSNSLGLTTRSGLWARDGDSIVNAKAVLAEQTAHGTEVELRDVRVFEFTPQGALTAFLHATSARHQGDAWLLQQVRQTRFDADGAHSEQQPGLTWRSTLNPRLLELSVVRPDYLSLSDLRRNIRHFRANGQDPGAYASAYWERWFRPLNVLLLVLAVLPFGFGTLRSGGLGKRVFIGILLAVVWHFLQLALVSLGNVYGLAVWLANLLPAAALASIAVFAYRRRT
ncbi:MAG TPA: LPS export ABC transporter permease LptG [Rhodanobacteraceae bacterium]|nr:LPS export ABC transporter permease LptG [Rhodanobacteraceae bacterium]